MRQPYDHPDIASAELTELLGMTRGAISKIPDTLEAKGLTRTRYQSGAQTQADAL